jgi:hypothetical protein
MTAATSVDPNADDHLADDGFCCVDHMRPELQEIINQGYRGEALIAATTMSGEAVVVAGMGGFESGNGWSDGRTHSPQRKRG